MCILPDLNFSDTELLNRKNAKIKVNPEIQVFFSEVYFVQYVEGSAGTRVDNI